MNFLFEVNLWTCEVFKDGRIPFVSGCFSDA